MNCVTSLFSYQQRAVDKLIGSRVAALFMDMGTGKSRTAIEFVRLRQERIDRVIWFCPVSLKETVRQEIIKHTDTPSERIYVFDDKTNRKRLPAAFWYIVGIESMSSSSRVVMAVYALMADERVFVICDESSYIKGHSAIRTRRITAVSENARYRLVLTGTPLSQGVVDLFAQMKFLSPKILGYRSFYSFARNHLVYSERTPGKIVHTLEVDELAAKIEPYTYQITKAECLDLPPKLNEYFSFSMTAEQADLYQLAKQELLSRPEEEINSYVIFQLFTALQEIVSGFWNHKDGLVEVKHRRLEMLQAAVDSVPEGEPVIIWCKFRYSVERICAHLTAHYGREQVALLYGDIDEKTRSIEIERFGNNDARFLVATQSTGGHGFTFNHAHHVIFYENGFKYSERIQAEDRCYRIGQALPVTYVDIVCSAGIDARIQEALALKANVVAQFRKELRQITNKTTGEARKLLEAL